MKLQAKRVLARISGEIYEVRYWCPRCQRHFWIHSQVHDGWWEASEYRCPKCGNRQNTYHGWLNIMTDTDYHY